MVSWSSWRWSSAELSGWGTPAVLIRQPGNGGGRQADAVTDFLDRFRAASRACTVVVLRGPRKTPAEQFAQLAQACTEFGIETSDWYGEEGGAVELLETRVAELLGHPAAVFLPTGTMAQQAVLRTWCERQRSWRVALPDIAHPVRHELDCPRLLHGFRPLLDHE